MKGRKTGGRKKGQKNKRTEAKMILAKEAAEAGITPLEYMLAIMRDESKPLDVRLDAAKSAAPYVHPRLAAVEHSGVMTVNSDVHELSDAELEAIVRGATLN